MPAALADLDLAQINAFLEEKTPEDVLRWAVERFGDRFAIQSSMQKTAGILMHMISTIAPETEIVFVDTGVHFPETLDTRDEFAQRYNLNIKTYKPALTFDQQFDQHGVYLHKIDDKNKPGVLGYMECCRLRKEVPFIAAVKGRFDAVAGGLTRAEGGARKDVPIILPDPRFEAFKINPLARWSEEQVDAYTAEHQLPVHPLYKKGYPSIGCWTCTTPIRPGEDKRAGRWRHIREANPDLASTPLYCGINIEDGGSGI